MVPPLFAGDRNSAITLQGDVIILIRHYCGIMMHDCVSSLVPPHCAFIFQHSPMRSTLLTMLQVKEVMPYTVHALKVNVLHLLV